jgi:hypothetical protein
MKVLATCLLLGVVLSGCTGMVKRSVSGNLFQSGKEYTYAYSTSVSAASNDYVSFASVFNLTGHLVVDARGNTLNVQLKDVKFGAYNGENSVYPPPSIVGQTYEQLNPLLEPFQITVDNGKVVGLTLGSDVPEWARNVKRGLANSLQVDLSQVTLGAPNSVAVQEKTIVGDCETDYEVIPQPDGHTQIRKYRSHAKCTNQVEQSRVPGASYHYCPDDNSRDTFNASGHALYDLSEKDGHVVVNRIVSGSSVTYFLFSTNGLQQVSYSHTVLQLEDVKDGANVAAPSNPKNYDNLKYVFAQTYDEDEDLTVPRPFYFHHKDIALDAESQTKALEQLYLIIDQVIDSLRTTGVFKDLKEFHRVSPLSIVPHVNTLDYEHLKQAYEKVKADPEVLKKKIFLDSLVITGTGPAALVIRDVVKDSDNFFTTGRLLAALVSYVRNPTEKLVKEFEGLLLPITKERAAKLNGRVRDFAFATLVKRACKKTGCQQSGLLEKYVKYFSDRFDSANHFEEQTAAVGALRNIGIGGAGEKLLSIVQNKAVDRTVRVQAIAGLKYLAKDPQVLRRALLTIFFDRQEHAELRTAAAKYAVVYAFSPEVVNQMVIYMWTEKCPLIKNYIYTLLKGVGSTTRPCIQTKGSYARTALTIFPPWTPNPKYSGNYLSDYYDREFNFGQMTDYVVHKEGSSFLPTAVYINVNGAIAGVGTNYLTLFLRIEGLGKAALNQLMKMKTQVTKFDDIKNLFSKIGVVERTGVPLKLELGLMLRGNIITYHAADKDTLKEIPKLFKLVSERAQKSYEADLLHLTMLGGVLIERPNEAGFPVTARSAVTGLMNIHANVNRAKNGDILNQETDLRIQAVVSGISGLSNHMPAFGSIFSVTAYRTRRVRLPRKFSLGLDLKQIAQQTYVINAAAEVPTEEDPAVIMIHASAVTTITADPSVRYRANNVAGLLTSSCPTCKPLAVISKGDKYRDTRQIGVLYKYLTGVKGGIKYFDCEKVHNRVYVAKQLRKIFGPENKNSGGRILSKIRLGLSYLRESLFYSPVTQTCGIKAYFYQDKTAKTIFQKVEGQIKVKYQAELNKKVGVKAGGKATLKMIYGGAEPKSRNFDLDVKFQTTGMTKRDLKVKAAVNDEITNKAGIVCVDVSTSFSKPQDFLSYEGVNEPTAERTITINYGATKDGSSCPDSATSPSIKYVRKSHRSKGQIEAAKADHWPYKQCREAQASGKYPGPLVAPVEACFWAANEQTRLREANITIDYKVDPEARNRWKRPGAVLATILMPYLVSEDTLSQVDEHAHFHGSNDGKLLNGRIAIDVDLTQGDSEADIHFHPSTGENEHYHGIDLDSLPLRLINPVSTRFPPLRVASMKLGLYGVCQLTQHAVSTFDNLTYTADISECPTLLSADCGPTPRYAVFANKNAGDKVALTIQIGGKKVEISDLNKAVVDGNEVPLSEEIYTEAKLFKLFKLDDNNAFLHSDELGVTVRYTGYYATVIAGSRYRAQSCGLCGNFNDMRTDDFNGPDNSCPNMSGNDMVKAYVLRDGSCAGVGSVCPSSA